METKHLTRALLVLIDQSIAIAQQVVKGHSAPGTLSPDFRQSIGQQLGILYAHKTSLEAPYADEGLAPRILEVLAEDILDVLTHTKELGLQANLTTGRVGEQGQ